MSTKERRSSKAHDRISGPQDFLAACSESNTIPTKAAIDKVA